MKDDINQAIASIYDAQAALKNAAKAGIDAGDVQHAQQCLSHTRELAEKQQQLEQIVKNLDKQPK